jgi:hypothetical protein
MGGQSAPSLRPCAGVGGYFFQQVTNDHGSGDQFGAFRGRVAAVGALLSYALKAGAQEVDFSARWFHEFAVRNRVRGDLIDATFNFPLYRKRTSLRRRPLLRPRL